MAFKAGLPRLTATAGAAVTAAEWEPVIEAIQQQMTVATVVSVIATVVAAGIGFVFMWWGVRKASKSLLAAAKNGKLKF